MAITKNFITRAYTLGALASVDCLKKNGSAPMRNACTKSVIKIESL